MSKVICLLGKSASGKDTVLNALVEEGVKRVISHTSRPMRSSEQNHREYHFIDYEDMIQMENNNDFIEMRKYDVVNDEIWLYGIHKNAIDLNSESNYICIVDCDGFKALQCYFGKKNIIGIYLYVQSKERLLRALNRCKIDDEAVDEIVRRYMVDNRDFEGIEDKVDFIIENEDFDFTVGEILDFIKSKEN